MWLLIRDAVGAGTRRAWVLLSCVWAVESAGRVVLHLVGRSRLVDLDEGVFIVSHGLVAVIFGVGMLRRSAGWCAAAMMLASGVWMTWLVSVVIDAQASVPPGPLDGALGSFVHVVVAVCCVMAWTRKASPHADRIDSGDSDGHGHYLVDSIHGGDDSSP